MTDVIKLPNGETIPLPKIEPNAVFNITVPLDGQVVEVVEAVRQLLAIRTWQALQIDRANTQIADLRALLTQGGHMLVWPCDHCGTDRSVEVDKLEHGAIFECGMCHHNTYIAFLTSEEFAKSFGGPDEEDDDGSLGTS